jgi:hypothetical protein
LVRRLSIENLESRNMMCGPDVNGDGSVLASDALAVINHISNDAAVYAKNLDVNCNGSVTALDALVIINELDRINRHQATHTVKFSISPNISTYGLSKEDIQWGIEAAFKAYEAVGDVDFQVVSSGAPYNISSGELYLGNGWHARGWVLGCCNIQIHNGWVSAGHSVNTPNAFWWKAITSKQALKQIMMHEIGHAVMNWGHSSDLNSSTDVFNSFERNSIINKWGESKL